MAIQLTESAAKQIRKQLAQRGKGIGLRVGVKDAGCSGFAYVYDYADEVRTDDHLIEAHDAEAGVQVQQSQRGRDLRLRRVVQRQGKGVTGDRWLVVGVKAKTPFDGIERVSTIRYPQTAIYEPAEQA
jgi:iron-sulfur cluster assembly accessory protein